MNQELVQFTDAHNLLRNKIPVVFPPVSLRDDVCKAIQEYVEECALIQQGSSTRDTVPSSWRNRINSLRYSLPHRRGLEQLCKRSSLRIRISLAKLSRVHFSHLYSTLDNQMEVPVQIAAYHFVTDCYLKDGDTVLDVGFGLGYGLEILAKKADRLSGLEVDRRAIRRMKKGPINPKITTLEYYDGYSLPFPERSFDVVTCIDVIEHVPDYMRLIRNLCKVAKRNVIISTPNKRSEHTNMDGSPKNLWHLREWSYEEFDEILKSVSEEYEWNFLNGPWNGPFSVSNAIKDDTMALTPAIKLNRKHTFRKT